MFTYFPSLPIFVPILRTVMYQPAEAHPGPSQAFEINFVARIVDVFKLTLVTRFAKKKSIMNV